VKIEIGKLYKFSPFILEQEPWKDSLSLPLGDLNNEICYVSRDTILLAVSTITKNDSIRIVFLTQTYRTGEPVEVVITDNHYNSKLLVDIE
jgi:hypothetical protein